MEETITVNVNNIVDMRANDWNFYAAGRVVSRKMAIQAIRLGVKVTAKWKPRKT